MADRFRILAAAALLGSLTACAPTLGPPPPGRGPVIAPPAAADVTFRASDFAWSQVPGRNTLSGALGHAGPVRYTCAGATVVLTPETPWAARRMQVLYKSNDRAALAVDDVRSRQKLAPPGDSNPYVKRAVCDAADHFTFTNLPDGSWYVVTLAKPVSAPNAAQMAIMRRVVTRGGRVISFEL
jgi:hypothetical protein